MQELLNNIRWPIQAKILLAALPIPFQSSERNCERSMLGLAGGNDESRVWRYEYMRKAGVCTPHVIQRNDWGNSEWEICLSQMRQSSLRKPKSSFPWDARRKYARRPKEGSPCTIWEKNVPRVRCKTKGCKKTARYKRTNTKNAFCSSGKVQRQRMGFCEIQQNSRREKPIFWQNCRQENPACYLTKRRARERDLCMEGLS